MFEKCLRTKDKLIHCLYLLSSHSSTEWIQNPNLYLKSKKFCGGFQLWHIFAWLLKTNLQPTNLGPRPKSAPVCRSKVSHFQLCVLYSCIANGKGSSVLPHFPDDKMAPSVWDTDGNIVSSFSIYKLCDTGYIN